jgi:hypothetical protein
MFKNYSLVNLDITKCIWLGWQKTFPGENQYTTRTYWDRFCFDSSHVYKKFKWKEKVCYLELAS